jgi:anti-anti-sigma regulatory factor
MLDRLRRPSRPQALLTEAGAGRDALASALRLHEVESWPECREVIVEGRLDAMASGRWNDCLRRIEDSDHDHVIIDLDRCESIDAAAVKRLVVVRELLWAESRELLVFGAVGEVRRRLEDIGAFDCDPTTPTPPGPGQNLGRARRARARGAPRRGPLSHLRRSRLR